MNQFPETALMALTITYCLFRLILWLYRESNQPPPGR
jgi:hypothetical protein